MLSELSAQRAEFLLVGAYALAGHGLPRATGDIDTALANLFLVVAVWLKYRSYRLKSLQSRVRRIACLATALSLMLAPVLYTQLAHGWALALPPLVLENVWQRNEAGFYSEGVLTPIAQEALAEWRESTGAPAVSDSSR